MGVRGKIYVLMGGDTPFILRPFSGKAFAFGGESYVHGIMDGEPLPFPKTNGILDDTSTKGLA